MSQVPRFRNAARALALLLALRPGLAAAAEPMPLRPELQIPLILKILTYDRHIESKAGEQVVVGIVYAPTDPSSVAAANEVGDVLFRFQDKTVKRLPIRYRLVEYSTPALVNEPFRFNIPTSPGHVPDQFATVRIGPRCEIKPCSRWCEYCQTDSATISGASGSIPANTCIPSFCVWMKPWPCASL